MHRLSAGAALPKDAPADFAALIAWWESKSAGGPPERAGLDPVEIASHLANVALLEAEGEDFRFRLVGEEVRLRYGALRGRRLTELLEGHGLEDTLAEHRACLASGRPTLSRRAEPAADLSDDRRYWRLLLPFARDGRACVLLAVLRFDL